MWGANRQRLHDILNKTFSQIMTGYGKQYLQDMNFLDKAVWPKVKKHDTYCSDSVSCDKWASSHRFPVARLGHEHVGQVFVFPDGRETARQGDINILAKAKPNRKCIPGKNTAVN